MKVWAAGGLLTRTAYIRVYIYIYILVLSNIPAL